jgi:hypothetical protein
MSRRELVNLTCTDINWQILVTEGRRTRSRSNTCKMDETSALVETTNVNRDSSEEAGSSRKKTKKKSKERVASGKSKKKSKSGKKKSKKRNRSPEINSDSQAEFTHQRQVKTARAEIHSIPVGEPETPDEIEHVNSAAVEPENTEEIEHVNSAAVEPENTQEIEHVNSKAVEPVTESETESMSQGLSEGVYDEPNSPAESDTGLLSEQEDGQLSGELNEDLHDDFEDVESDSDEESADDAPDFVMRHYNVPSGSRQAKAPRRRGTNFAKPYSDNDPVPDPSVDDPAFKKYTPDSNSWTRNNQPVSREPFLGKLPLGATFKTTPHTKPLKYFLMFFPYFLFTLMAKWTNITIGLANIENRAKAVAHGAVSRFNKIPDTTTAEIKAWFGIRIVMGAVKITNMKNYWSNRTGWRNQLIAGTMSRHRYESICEHLKLANPSEDDPDTWPRETAAHRNHFYNYTKKHPLYPLQGIWNTVLQRCRKNYNLARELALDEAMVAYKGMKAKLRRIFMPLKPTRVGFKIYALAESASGYIANFAYMSNTRETMHAVVEKLMEPFRGKFHHVFTDKAYSSVEVANTLLAQNVYLTGAIKTNARGLPRDLLFDLKKNPNARRMKQLNRCPRGTFYVRQRGEMTYAVWKDSKILSVISTAHSGFRNKESDEIYRRFSKDGIAAATRQKVPAPAQAISYQQNYGGVDKADQLRSYFTMSRKSNRWFFQILFFLVDICRVNAFICFRQANPGKKVTHAKFVMDLAEALIAGFTEDGRRASQDTRLLNVPNTRHGHVNMGADHSKSCVGCLQQTREEGPTGQPKRVHRTVYGCLVCNKHMCLECFQVSHPSGNSPVSSAPNSPTDTPPHPPLHPPANSTDDEDESSEEAQ